MLSQYSQQFVYYFHVNKLALLLPLLFQLALVLQNVGVDDSLQLIAYQSLVLLICYSGDVARKHHAFDLFL